MESAFEVEGSVSGDLNPVAGEFTPEFAATGGELAGMKVVFSQSSRPIRNKHTMGRAGDGIFGHAYARGKKAGDEITVTPRGGGDGAVLLQLGESCEIRRQLAEFLFGGEDSKIGFRLKKLRGSVSESADNGIGRWESASRAGGEIEFQFSVPSPLNVQRSRP
jgi:hypothetical protein